MKLIIDIPVEDYKECKFRNDLLSLGGKPTDLTFNMRMETLIAEGTSLQAELEEIKAEISKLTRYWTSEDKHINLVSDNAVNRILDKHIKEIDNDTD